MMKTLRLTFSLLFIAAANVTFAQQNTIPTTGNVGLGTTNPNAKLDVKGRVKIDSTLIVKDSATFEKNMTVQQDMRIEGDSRFNNVNVDGYLHVAGETKLGSDVRLTSLGAIADMTNKGVVVTDAYGTLKKVPYDTMVYILKSQVYAAPEPLNPCIFFAGSPNWTSAPNRLYVACPEVKVGVGTSNPQTNLDVQGTTFTKRVALNTDPTQLGTKYFHMKVTETSPSYQNAPVFLIENNDRPLLQVNNNGILRSREVILDLNTSWPDYVFQPDYQLLGYDALRTYIGENGHLPNVPSAAEMEQTGIEVGNTQTLMMEKIEELTLYILELEQRIKTLEAEKTSNHK